jgi:hypothetical protein
LQDTQPQRSQTPIEDRVSLLGSPTQSIQSLSSAQSDSPLPHVIQTKCQHDAISESDDDEVIEVHIAKAPKFNKTAGRPKAADYDLVAKEVILSAANTYRALLASQGAFPTSLEELELVKRSWKRVNDDSKLTPMTLTPDIVRIVSNFLFRNLTLFFILTINNILRSRLEALRPVARQKPRRLLLLRHYTALTAGEVRRQLPKTAKKQKN